MKKKILSLLISIILTTRFSFAGIVYPDSIKDEIPEPDRIALQIINETARSLEKKYKMHACGFGMRERFKYLSISFQVNRPIEVDEARNLLIESVEELIENINSSKEIRPYLKEYPFTFQNAGITLLFSDQKGHDCYHPLIIDAMCTPRGLHFNTLNSKTHQYEQEYTETHEEALKKINDFRNKKNIPAS